MFVVGWPVIVDALVLLEYVLGRGAVMLYSRVILVSYLALSLLLHVFNRLSAALPSQLTAILYGHPNLG